MKVNSSKKEVRGIKNDHMKVKRVIPPKKSKMGTRQNGEKLEGSEKL